MPEWAWLVPILSRIRATPEAEADELESWLATFYPEIEASGAAEAAHLPDEQARRRAGWAKTKAIACARWRVYLTRTPREHRNCDARSRAHELELAIEREIAEHAATSASGVAGAFTPEALGIKVYRH
jgi:hypothetical protein